MAVYCEGRELYSDFIKSGEYVYYVRNSSALKSTLLHGVSWYWPPSKKMHDAEDHILNCAILFEK
jgi:hypothetical protein